MTDLAELMSRATDDLQPDVSRIVAEGTSRGRYLRSRRRLANSLATLSVAGVIGAAAVVVPSHLAGGAPSTPNGFASGGGASTGSASPHAVALPSPTELSTRLGSMLPEGARQPLQKWGDGSFAAAAWSFVPAGSPGAGRVDVLVSRYGALMPGAKPTGAAAKNLRPAGTSGVVDPQTACREAGYDCTEVAGGAWLDTSTMHEPASGGGASPVIGAHAELWTRDGLVVSATAYNALGEKDYPVTRTSPVLDTAQLAALAEQVGAAD